MKFPVGLTRTFGRQILLSQKHAPTVMVGLGVIGIVATAVMASKATLELDGILTEAHVDLARTEEAAEKMPEEYPPDMKKRDTIIVYTRAVKKITRLYASTIFMGAISISLILGAHSILMKRNAGVMAAYAVLDKGFNEYRARVRKEFGDEKEYELRHGMVSEEKLEPHLAADGVMTHEIVFVRKKDEDPSVYARYFDDHNSNWVEEVMYNKIFLQGQQVWANIQLDARGHLFLNEVYDALGFPRTSAGAVVGWVKRSEDGDSKVDFGLFVNSMRGRKWINGDCEAYLLDFNVDGLIYDQVG
jgi:hypothetical protein